MITAGKRWPAVLVIVTMVTCAALAGGSREAAPDMDEGITLRIYAQYSASDERAAYDYAAAAMKKLMPEVTLELEIMAQDDDQKIKTYAATNNLPDIFVVTPALKAVFKESNLLLNLDPYIAETGLKDKLLPSTIPMLVDDDGSVWAVPNVGQWIATLFYNKELFDRHGVTPPRNYEEMLAAVRTFRANDVLPLALFAQEKWPGVQLLDTIVTRHDPRGLLAVDTGEARITDPVYRRAAEKFAELVAAGLISRDAFNTNYDQANSMFMSGRAAMIQNGAWGMSMYGEAMGDNVGILYYPYADAGTEGRVRWNMSGGGLNQAFAVSASTKHPDVAGRFAALFALKFAEGRVVKVADPNPIMRNAPQPESGYNEVQLQFVKDSANFQTMTTFPWGLTDPAFKVAVEDFTHSLLAGAITVDQFIANVDNATR